MTMAAANQGGKEAEWSFNWYYH